jgi:hypothetical protein
MTAPITVQESAEYSRLDVPVKRKRREAWHPERGGSPPSREA